MCSHFPVAYISLSLHRQLPHDFFTPIRISSSAKISLATMAMSPVFARICVLTLRFGCERLCSAHHSRFLAADLDTSAEHVRHTNFCRSSFPGFDLYRLFSSATSHLSHEELQLLNLPNANLSHPRLSYWGACDATPMHFVLNTSSQTPVSREEK